MNRIHRVLWNAARGCYVTANETTGMSQARGKALAVMAVAAMAIGTASAGIVNGVLEPDDGKTTVVIANWNGEPDADLPLLNQPASSVTLIQDNVAVSGINQAVSAVHVVGNELRLTGESINIAAALFAYGYDGTLVNSGVIAIGQAGTAKTMAQLDNVFVGGVEMGSTEGNGYLSIENASVHINDLKIDGESRIDADSELTISKLTTIAAYSSNLNGQGMVNKGTVTIDTIDSYKNSSGRYAFDAYLINNEGTLNVTSSDAQIAYNNKKGATANFGTLRLNSGSEQFDVKSQNAGTLNVSNSFVVSGLSAWGSGWFEGNGQNSPEGVDMIGRLSNTGVLNVGTEEANANAEIYGHLFNDGGEFNVHGNVTVANTVTSGFDLEERHEAILSNTDGASLNVDGDLSILSGTFVNENATIALGGSLISSIDLTNRGVIKTTVPGSILSINGTTVTNAATQEGTTSLEGFSVMVQDGGVLNLAGGSADLHGLLLESNGSAYIGEAVADISNLTVNNETALHVAGSATVETFNVLDTGVVDQALFGIDETGSGKITVTSTLNNRGSITLHELAASEYSDIEAAHADIGKFTVTNGTINGTVKAGELIVGNGTDAANLTVSGSATEAERGNLRVTSSVVVNKEANITVAAEDGQTASMKVVGQSGTSEIDGILRIAGTVEVGKNGTLYAEGVTLDGGALGVTGSSAQTDSLSATAAGGAINLSQGGKLTVAGGSTAGITFNFNGAYTQVDFAESGKWFENATLNLNNRNWNLTGSGGDGFGVNTVNINEGSTVSYTDNAVLKNNSTITVNEGAVLDADRIGFEDRYSGSLTLAGGTLVTSLDQIFSEVTADEFIEGTNVETGEIEKIPVSGSQSVGTVKDELTGENGIKYESGAFEFTDDGWTVNAVNSASSMLQSAFDNFDYSESTLIFSGTQDDESGAFGVEDANKLNNNIVLSGTILAAGNQNLTFGESSETAIGAVVTVPVTGFQAIADASNVTVTGGHHLYLTGFENDKGTASLLTDTKNNEIHITENGKLTLGLDGHQTGGSVSVILAENGTVEVSQGGTFSVDALRTQGNSVVTVDKDGNLNVENFTDTAETQTTVNGTFNVGQALTVNGKFANNGSVNTDSLASFADLNNSGRIETAAAFNGTKVVNTGVIESDAAAFFDNLTNSGTVTGTEIAVGDDSTFGLLQNQTGGTIETAGNVALKLAEANANAGTIKGKDVTVNLADGAPFANTGSIEASGTAAFDSVSNSGKIAAVAVNVGSGTKAGMLQNNTGASIAASESVDLRLTGENTNAGQITASGVSINLDANAVFTNSGTIKDTSEANHINLAGGEGSKFVNSGALETAGLVISGLNFETTSKIAANSLAVTDGSFTVTDSGSVEVESLDVSGSTLANKGELSVAEMNVAESSTVINEDSMTIDKLALDGTSTVEQSEAGLISVKDMTVTGTSFDLDSGTWVIDNENGITFVNKTGDKQAGRINVTSGKEYVTAAADVDNVVYDVTKTLTFGKEAGLADKLGITDATGILVVDKGVEISATGAIRVGAAIATASARAPQQEANFTVAADSVTIFTGNAFGKDGIEAGIYADPANKLSATIDKDAKAVLTNIQQSGQYKLIEGFDLSANIDKESGEWIGGWTGENGKYVTVDNGSDLEWKTEVSYDKETNTIVADTVAADVRSVYNLATPDIANAALSPSADASKGADVTFMQAVINNKDLNVAQTERIVNSVTQIAASLGTAANFLSDASSLMDTVEARTGLLSDAGKKAGLWVRVEGGKYKMDGLEIAGGQDAGYDTNTYGVTFGADGMVTDGLRIGAAFSYLNGSADADGDVLSGTNDYDTYGLQAYAAYDVNDTMRVSGEIGWFHSSAELVQSISFANVNKAEADVDTDAFTFGIRGDWRFDVNGFTIVPHVGLRGIYMMNDEFTTTIDGKDAFKNDQDDTFTMQMPVGVSVEKAFATASGWNVVPTADVTVAPQFGDTEYDTTITGIGTGVSQAVTADMAGNVLGRVAFGVKAENGASSFGAYYGFTAGDAGRQDHAFNLSFSYRF